MSNMNRTTQHDRDRKAIAAIQKYLMKLATILVTGMNYTPVEFIALLQKDIDLGDAATHAREAFLAAADANAENRAKMVPILAGFRAFLGNMFTDPSILAEFGFPVRKRTVPTTEVKAAAVNKRSATRQARHTMGKKQKAKIHGEVPATSSQTAPSAAAPATPVSTKS
jgi:hypothetical protein